MSLTAIRDVVDTACMGLTSKRISGTSRDLRGFFVSGSLYGGPGVDRKVAGSAPLVPGTSTRLGHRLVLP